MAGTTWLGLADAAAAVVADGVATVEGVHGAVASRSFAPLALAPAVREVSGIVRLVHDGIAAAVYGGIRAAVAAGGGAARIAAGARTAGHEPVPESRGGLAVAFLNGFAGDRLAERGNPLAASMGIRHRGREVALDRGALAAAFPEASSRVVVFVHGLAGNEAWWRFGAERHYGDRTTTHGSRLQADLGVTPLWVRYNSGLRIGENGRQLARLVDRLVAAWPAAVEELVLVGHSMGGLVIRSACHHAREAGLLWTGRVRHVVFLGSPHGGAPLEKVAHAGAWLLGLVDVTRPFADLIDRRSAGIKDLRHGTLLDDAGDVTRDVPWLEDASHYFVAATVTRSPRHPLGAAVGDLLVRHPSASGRGRMRHTHFPLEHDRHFGPMNHFELLNHPDVYVQMRRWLS